MEELPVIAAAANLRQETSVRKGKINPPPIDFLGSEKKDRKEQANLPSATRRQIGKKNLKEVTKPALTNTVEDAVKEASKKGNQSIKNLALKEGKGQNLPVSLHLRNMTAKGRTRQMPVNTRPSIKDVEEIKNLGTKP